MAWIRYHVRMATPQPGGLRQPHLWKPSNSSTFYNYQCAERKTPPNDGSQSILLMTCRVRLPRYVRLLTQKITAVTCDLPVPFDLKWKHALVALLASSQRTYRNHGFIIPLSLALMDHYRRNQMQGESRSQAVRHSNDH